MINMRTSCLNVRRQDKLSDTVPWTNYKRPIRIVILEDNLDFILVVRVDNTGQDPNPVLHGQSSTRLNTSISSLWEID